MNENLPLTMSLNPGNYVVQANDLIIGRQSLSLNEAKILRLAIMQIIKEDREFKPYVVKIKELADLIGISDSNVYRDIHDLCDGISSKPVKIINNRSWKTIPWVKRCEYEDGTGNIHILLNDELKPYLINLKEYYTQYYLENILAMKSIYGVRIFELIQRELKIKVIPKDGTDVKISVQTIKESCECDDKYSQFGMFKKKVVDTAIKDIERVTLYTITYDYIKKSRMVIGFIFHLNMRYH